MRQSPTLWARTRVGPSGRAALELLACCPRMPADVVGVLLGHRQAVSTAQLLARLRRAELARYQEVMLGPQLGPRRVRLWTLTAEGRAFVAARGPARPGGDARQIRYGEPEGWRDPARQRGTPLLIACHRLLAAVASRLEPPVRVCIWEHPWIRTVAPTDAGRRRRVRLPAAAVLQSRPTQAGQAERLLLLPDVGTAPLASYRPALRALIDMRRTVLTNAEDEPVLIVGVATSRHSSSARIQAWRSLLQELACRADEPALRARVLALQTGPAGSRNGYDRQSTGQVDEVFALVARHPLMTRQQLASLLCTST